MIPRRVLVTSVAACALLAGCGLPAGPAPAPAPSAPAPTAPADDGAAAVALPWPARSDAEAAGLQQAVDGGAQPWLLDPAEVARSYAAAALGWTDATTSVTGDSVEVTGPGGTRHLLAVAQPGRTGPGGIWVVTADRPVP